MQHHLPLPTLLNAPCLFKLSICPLFTEMCRALLALDQSRPARARLGLLRCLCLQLRSLVFIPRNLVDDAVSGEGGRCAEN
jgi:hypothetical protein